MLIKEQKKKKIADLDWITFVTLMKINPYSICKSVILHLISISVPELCLVAFICAILLNCLFVLILLLNVYLSLVMCEIYIS